ncbi:alpha/beta fold hydrolase [Pacificimonas sp. ICDLI1SI03]
MSLPILTAQPGERRGYVDGPNGQIHYRMQGEGADILLIHMAPWSSIAFRHAMPALAKAGYRAIAIDLPGHGMSDPCATPSIEAYAASAAAVIDALVSGPCLLLGHRGGGLVAGRLAATRPELAAALILDNVPFMSAADRAARIGKFPDDQSIAPDGAHIAARWRWVREVGDPDWSDETVHIAVITYFMHGPWKEYGHKVIPLYDFQADIDAIKCPALLIGSRRDAVFASAMRLRAARPDWGFSELPGGPGMVTDRTEEWMVPVRSFCDAIATQNAG